jgi:ABC-type polysaccharide/polyol phosphate export permease
VKHWLEWSGYIRYFAFEDLRKQHARSKLGYFWIVFSQFINIAGIAFVWAVLWHQDITQFFPYISAGVIVWNFASATLNECTRIFVANSPIIQNFKFPAWVFVTQMVMRNWVILLYATVVHLFLFLLFGKSITWWHLLVLPAYIVIGLLMVQAGTVLAYIGTRFRDFAPAFGNLTYLFFLVTPIIWDPNLLPAKYLYLIHLNPFYYIINFVRQPLLGLPPHLWDTFMIGMMLLVSTILQFYCARRYEKRLVFWV